MLTLNQIILNCLLVLGFYRTGRLNTSLLVSQSFRILFLFIEVVTLNVLHAKRFVMFVFRNKFILCITGMIFVVRLFRINLCQLVF